MPHSINPLVLGFFRKKMQMLLSVIRLNSLMSAGLRKLMWF